MSGICSIHQGHDAFCHICEASDPWLTDDTYPPEKRRCAFCGGPVEGNYSIHRDGFSEGPEVDLCDEHGGSPVPTERDIWDVIVARKKAREKLHGQR